MKILALETSTETASVALLCGDRLLERNVAGRPGHSETILPEIRLLLAEAGVALEALDAIADLRLRREDDDRKRGLRRPDRVELPAGDDLLHDLPHGLSLVMSGSFDSPTLWMKQVLRVFTIRLT